MQSSTETTTGMDMDSYLDGPTALSRRSRPWFILLLALQVVILAVRWRMGDVHGALLMFAVVAVGVLAVSVGGGGVDAVYGGYFGLMAFVSGLLDMNLAIENMVWSHWNWNQMQKRGWNESELMSILRPAVYFVCAAMQLSSSFIAYVIYKDAEAFEDMDSDDLPFATQEQARIYTAVLQASDHHLPAREHAPGGQDLLYKAYGGTSHKLV